MRRWCACMLGCGMGGKMGGNNGERIEVEI